MRRTLLALSLLAGACTTPATEVMVSIDAESEVQARTDQLVVRVLGGAEATPASAWAVRLQTTYPEVSWPHRIALVPIESETVRNYQVEVRAERADGTLVTSSALRGGYVKEQTKLVVLRLEDACLDVDCADMRCQDGRCVDPLVDVGSAPDLGPDAGR